MRLEDVWWALKFIGARITTGTKGKTTMYVCGVCVRVCVCECVCACVIKRERERERETSNHIITILHVLHLEHAGHSHACTSCFTYTR